ncbi:MAG TPA: sigma 54-interacting transcriptional regulator [bacterium]|jgi:transcriptional regulator with GAF, ATPase, and Fis domain
MPTTIEVHHWLETHDAPFVLLDEELRVVAANRAYGATFQVDPDTLVGRPGHSLAHHGAAPAPMRAVDPYYSAIATRDRTSWLQTYFDEHARVHWVRITLFPLQAEDGTPLFGELIQEVASQETAVDPAGKSHTMVGYSPAFAETVEKLTLAADASGVVLIQGETGTGKELAAAFIHRNSARSTGPFLCLDCASLPESLCESEVFGHERGSFTGSIGTKRGLFELAHGGTLFLDEIGEMPLAMQAKLLRVLESSTFRRVGGERPIQVDVRIVCATNRELWDCVHAGSFREDLYYRVACFCVRMPPLRDRLADIPLLVDEILRHCRSSQGDGRITISPSAVALLSHYDYPGNVRELRNILEVAVASSDTLEVDAKLIEELLAGRSEARRGPDREAHLGRLFSSRGRGRQGDLDAIHYPPDPRSVPSTSGSPNGARRRPQDLEAMERQYLVRLLADHGGHRRHTAAAIGISERTLYRKLKRYGLI